MPADKMKSANDSPSRIESGNYVAEILQGCDSERFWYYVIQRKSSNKIIDLMKFDSKQQAVEAVQIVLARLNQAAAAGAGAG